MNKNINDVGHTSCVTRWLTVSLCPRTLPLDEIHIWRAPLSLPAPNLQALRRILSADEVERADRFVFEKHQHRFIAARGQLRHILSHYVGGTPAEIDFTYGPRGKPALTPSSSLCFNVSHSGDLALYALGYGRRIGVDIEQIRTNVEFVQLAQRCFSPQERATLRTLPVEQVPQAFFNCWTRKEAYIKAIGEGLYCPLDSFDVSLIPAEAAALLEIRDSEQHACDWKMIDLLPAPQYAAALVVEGSEWQPQYWQWSAELSE